MTASADNILEPRPSPRKFTMLKYAQDYVARCDKCQRHEDMHIAPPAELTSLTPPWPFAWWGIDLLGPFPKAVGQLKYLVIALDYSTKWIIVEPLAKITAKLPALVISKMGLHLLIANSRIT